MELCSPLREPSATPPCFLWALGPGAPPCHHPVRKSVQSRVSHSAKMVEYPLHTSVSELLVVDCILVKTGIVSFSL